MKLCIIGAGALGSLLGFVLSAEAEVWLLDPWQAHVDAITARGLRCEADGVETVRHPHATSDPAALGACDAALVLVKAHQTGWAAEQLVRIESQEPRTERTMDDGRWTIESGGKHQVSSIRLPPSPSVSMSPAHPLTRSPAHIVTLQNGVGNRERLAATLGAARVGQAVTSLGATLLGPGQVRWAGRGATVFGSAPDRAAAQQLADLFAACGLDASLADDLDGLVWGKLLVNVGINALTALLRVPNGALAELPAARMLLAQAVTEAAQVAAARGTQLPYVDPVGHVLGVARATAENRSSMLQDVLRGSPSEIDTINGAVVREGQHLGVSTPVNAMLVALVSALDGSAAARVG